MADILEKYQALHKQALDTLSPEDRKRIPEDVKNCPDLLIIGYLIAISAEPPSSRDQLINLISDKTYDEIATLLPKITDFPADILSQIDQRIIDEIRGRQQ